jgi:patatin-related protein
MEQPRSEPTGARGTRVRPSHELRIALAMRGGVSLAVWMGGSCREVARLRHQAQRLRRSLEHEPRAEGERDDPEPPGTYEKLLRYYGYDGVAVDVLAGTSAGGLNGALMAAHLVYGMPFDHRIRDIWIQVGHLETLTRAPKEKAPPSLLLGDEKFFERVREKAVELIHEARTGCEPVTRDPLRLILTATRLNPRDDMFRPNLGPLLAVGQSRAHFRFRHRGPLRASAPGGPLSDFGAPAPDGSITPEQARTIDCLAYAARTTSSFPGAFEPARPFVKVPGNPETDPRTHRPVDVRGVSSETGCPDDDGGCVELIDGGVLDNIPIAWAVRAIAAAPADRPVSRWLMYLQPVPPLRPDPETRRLLDQRRVTRLVRLLGRTQRIKSDTESLLEDADEMRRVMFDVRRRDAAAAFAANATDDQSLVQLGRRELDGYRALAGGMEADRIVRLLEDPIAIIGPDPLPLTGTAYPLAKLDETDDSQAFLARLRERESIRELAHGEDPAPDHGDPPQPSWFRFRSPMAAARTATLLLDWVHAIERRWGAAQPASPEPMSPVAQYLTTVEWRRKIYAARFASEVLIAARDRVLLALARSASPNEHPVTMVRSASARVAAMVRDAPMPGLDDLLPVTPELQQWGVVSVGQRLAQRWETWAEEFAEKAVNSLESNDKVATVQPHDCDWHEHDLDELWRLLASIALEISQSDLRLEEGFRGFDGMTSVDDASERLWAAELLVGPARIDTLSGNAEICLATVSAANQSPLEDLVFGSLRDDERVSRKLSGNQVANFASFLSARWRAADWTWGRLDAAQSLVAVIAHRDRAPEDHSVERLKEMFITPPQGPHATDWRKVLEDRWNARQDDRDLKVTPENLHDRTVDVMTERLQWEILAEEIPVVMFLHRRSSRRQDEPPSSEELQAVSAENGGPPDAKDLEEFGTIGNESVVTLLPKPDLRRSLLRIGLVGWRAIQPSGSSFLKAKLPRATTGLTVKPLAWIPTLFALTAPWPSILADVLVWLAVVQSTEHWVSVPATPVLLVAALISWWVWAWQLRSRRKRADGSFPKWPYVLALGVTLVLVAAFVVGLVFDPRWTELSEWARVGVVTGLIALAGVFLLFWILRATWQMLLMLLAAVATGFGVAYFVVHPDWNHEGVWDWQALALIAVPLLVVGFALTYFFPKAPEPE